jgi:hypothetical protein
MRGGGPSPTSYLGLGWFVKIRIGRTGGLCTGGCRAIERPHLAADVDLLYVPCLQSLRSADSARLLRV